MLLGPIHQSAERAGGPEHVRQIDLELPSGENGRRGGVGERTRPELQLLRQADGILRGLLRAVWIPYWIRRTRKNPGSPHLVAIHCQTFRRGEVRQDYVACNGFASGALGPGPAVRGNGAGKWCDQLERRISPFPGDAKLI